MRSTLHIKFIALYIILDFYVYSQLQRLQSSL